MTEITHDPRKAENPTFVDPVCGMSISAAEAAGTYDYQGKTYYFCAPGCLNSFKKDPGKYLAPDYKPSM